VLAQLIHACYVCELRELLWIYIVSTTGLLTLFRGSMTNTLFVIRIRSEVGMIKLLRACGECLGVQRR
jgi:hypothetical protein